MKQQDAGFVVRLRNEGNRKPLDVGCGRLSASIVPDGRFRSVNGYHPEQGFITLSPMTQFPNDQWYNSNFVRQYRSDLANIPDQNGATGGFGLRPLGKALRQDYYYRGYSIPGLTFEFEEAEAVSEYFAVEEQGEALIIHRMEIRNTAERDIRFPYVFGGIYSLNRCSYGQLTEGGPILVPPLENRLVVGSNRFSLTNPNISAEAEVVLFDDEQPLELSPLHLISNGRIAYEHRGEKWLPKGESGVISAVYRLLPRSPEQTAPRPFPLTPSVIEKLRSESLRASKQWKEDKKQEAEGRYHPDFVIKRNIEYLISCCSVPLDEDYICVITDHQLLPLSWNRDAYYMIQFLMESTRQAERLLEIPSIAQWNHRVSRLVRGHLLWMFERADRPEGYWGRAYLTHGYCKDNIFQLDQQCYPLLELCDYYEAFQDRETVARVLPVVGQILDMILRYKDDNDWLFRTGETPADDKVDYPYHFSSQVLMWHTIQELDKLNREFDFWAEDLSAWAARIRQDCLTRFATEHEGKPVFAYLTDLKGNFQTYHDANDLPSVYAPLWGFCRADDERWRNTMSFAFSESNIGGYYQGAYAGLGSVHTPHPWPLGDGQELLLSLIEGDAERFDAVWKKLQTLIQWDGLASEAVDEQDGSVVSRHWFSWPGTFISTVLLYGKGRKKEERYLYDCRGCSRLL